MWSPRTFEPSYSPKVTKNHSGVFEVEYDRIQPCYQWHDTNVLAQAQELSLINHAHRITHKSTTDGADVFTNPGTFSIDFQSQFGFVTAAGKKAKKAAAAAARSKWANDDNDTPEKNGGDGNDADEQKSANGGGEADGSGDTGDGDKKNDVHNKKEPEEVQAEEEWGFATTKKGKKAKKGKHSEPIVSAVEEKADEDPTIASPPDIDKDKKESGLGTWGNSWTTGTATAWNFLGTKIEPDSLIKTVHMEMEPDLECESVDKKNKKKKGKNIVEPCPIPMPTNIETSTPVEDSWSFSGSKKDKKKNKKSSAWGWEFDVRSEPEHIRGSSPEEANSESLPENGWSVPVSKEDKKKKKRKGSAAKPESLVDDTLDVAEKAKMDDTNHTQMSDLVEQNPLNTIPTTNSQTTSSNKEKRNKGRSPSLEIKSVSEPASDVPAFKIGDDPQKVSLGNQDKNEKSKYQPPEPVVISEVEHETPKVEALEEDWKVGAKKDKRKKAKDSSVHGGADPVVAIEPQQNFAWSLNSQERGTKTIAGEDIPPVAPDPPAMGLSEPEDWTFGTSSKSKKERKKREKEEAEAKRKKKMAEEQEKLEAAKEKEEEKEKDEQARLDREKVTSPIIKLSKKELFKADKLKAKLVKEAAEQQEREEREAAELKVKEEAEAAAAVKIARIESEIKAQGDTEAKETPRISIAFAKLPKREQERIKKKEKADRAAAAEQEELLKAAAKELEEQGKSDANLLEPLADAPSKSYKKGAELSRTGSKTSGKSKNSRDSLDLDRKSSKSPFNDVTNHKSAATVSEAKAGAFSFWEANKKSAADSKNALSSPRVSILPSISRKAVGGNISERLKVFELAKEDTSQPEVVVTAAEITKSNSPSPSSKTKKGSKHDKLASESKSSKPSNNSLDDSDILGSFPKDHIDSDMPSQDKKSSKKSSKKDKDAAKINSIPLPSPPPPALDAPPSATSDKLSKNRKERATVERKGSSWGTWVASTKKKEAKQSREKSDESRSPTKISPKEGSSSNSSKTRTIDDKVASGSSDRVEKRHKSSASKPPISRSTSVREPPPSSDRRNNSHRHSLQEVGGLLSPEPNVTGKAARILGLGTRIHNKNKSEHHSKQMDSGPEPKDSHSRPPVSNGRRSYARNGENDVPTSDSDVSIRRSPSSAKRASLGGMFGSFLLSKPRPDNNQQSSTAQHEDESRGLRRGERKVKRSHGISQDRKLDIRMTGAAVDEDQEARRAARRAKRAERDAKDKAAEDAQRAKDDERHERRQKRTEAEEAARQKDRVARREARKQQKLAEEVEFEAHMERRKGRRAARETVARDVPVQDVNSRPHKPDRQQSTRDAEMSKVSKHDEAKSPEDYFDSRNGSRRHFLIDETMPAKGSTYKDDKRRKGQRPGWPHSGTDSWVKDHLNSPAPPSEEQKATSVKAEDIDDAGEEEHHRLRKTRRAKRESRHVGGEEEKKKRRDARRAERDGSPLNSPMKESKGGWWRKIAGG